MLFVKLEDDDTHSIGVEGLTCDYECSKKPLQSFACDLHPPPLNL